MKMLDLDPVGTIFRATLWLLEVDMDISEPGFLFCPKFPKGILDPSPHPIRRQEAVGINGFTGFPWRREVFGAGWKD